MEMPNQLLILSELLQALSFQNKKETASFKKMENGGTTVMEEALRSGMLGKKLQGLVIIKLTSTSKPDNHG